MSEISHSLLSKHSWWKRRTKLEINLLIFSTLLITAIVILILIQLYSKSNYQKSKICQDEECIKTSARLLENMDPNIDPCDDFFKFSCGKYIENTQIPEDEATISIFQEAQKRIDENIKIILEKPIGNNEIKPFKQTKQLYRMCINSAETEEKDFEHIKKMFQDFGGWPILQGEYWNEDNFDWKNTQYNFRKVGFSHSQFISTGVRLFPKNSTRNIFTIDEPYDVLNILLKEGYRNDFVRIYQEYLIDVAIFYGATRHRAIKDIRQYMEFRIELAKITTPLEKRRNAKIEYNPMTIRQLQLDYPILPWREYINSKLEPYVNLNYEDIVIVTIPQYLEKLDSLLKKTPKRAIANYLFISIAENYNFNDKMRKRLLEVMKIFEGVKDEFPKWKQCIFRNDLHLARSAMYVREFLKDKSKFSVGELVGDVKLTFKKKLIEYRWMDSKTIKRALEKVERMGFFIGYPDEILINEEIEKHYKGLEIDEESMLKTSLAMRIWARNEKLKLYYKPHDRNNWKTKALPTHANALYKPYENYLELPTGILHQPFFDVERPQYLNYGAIGSIVGHEIIHGFDDRGRQYDKDGNLVDWWEKIADENFHKKSQCILDQYVNYDDQIKMTNLDSVNTQGENIADNGGIKIAYLAYQRWLKRNEPEPKLPGLSYTPQQLFWISAATEWCSKMRPEMKKMMIMNNVHLPSYYRVNIPFQNSGFFAKDFNCTLGSRMNPRQKCSLW